MVQSKDYSSTSGTYLPKRSQSQHKNKNGKEVYCGKCIFLLLLFCLTRYLFQTCATLAIFCVFLTQAYPLTNDEDDDGNDLITAADEYYQPLFSLRRYSNEKRRIYNFRPDYDFLHEHDAYNSDGDDFPTLA